MIDRTTKLLLSLIVLALWGLLLRPVFTPVPSQAAARQRVTPLSSARFSAPVMQIHPTNGYLYVVDNAGCLYLVDQNSLGVRKTVLLVPKP
jgi:hypothetical protein